MTDDFIWSPEASNVIGAVPVKRFTLNFGVNDRGQIVGITFVPNNNLKISVVPGKTAYMTKTNAANGQITTTEFALGPFGWDYERMPPS